MHRKLQKVKIIWNESYVLQKILRKKHVSFKKIVTKMKRVHSIIRYCRVHPFIIGGIDMYLRCRIEKVWGTKESKNKQIHRSHYEFEFGHHQCKPHREQ